jgi:hypothetical protein
MSCSNLWNKLIWTYTKDSLIESSLSILNETDHPNNTAKSNIGNVIVLCTTMTSFTNQSLA